MISVDTIYQTSLAVLNKEQRGFLTPVKYNLYSEHAQTLIFEQYFYDLEYFESIPGNQTEYADMIDILYDKIAAFEKTDTLTWDTDHYNEPSDLYRVGELYYNGAIVERMSKREYLDYSNSDKAAAENSFPVYYRTSDGFIVFGSTEFDGTQTVDCFYIRKPSKPIWNYTEVLNEPQYNATGSVNFEIHPSDAPELVMKIITLAGIEVKDPMAFEAAVQEELKQVQRETL